MPAVVAVIAISYVFDATRGPEFLWLVAWWLIDFLSGGSTSVGFSARAAKIPLLAALVVTGTVATIAAYFPDLAQLAVGTQLNLFLIVLWALALTTAGFRALIPHLLPKRTLRVVASRDQSPATQNERVFHAARNVEPEIFVRAVLAEVKRQDIELVELSFGIDAEVIRELSWELRYRDVELYLPLFDLGLDPGRVRALSATDRSGLLIAPSRPGLLVRAAKRVFDAVVGILLVVIFSPILLAVAIAIKVSMPGPVFYTQERIGLEGRPFRIFKFRSMVVDADSQLGKLLEDQGTAAQPLFKVDSDPRITPLGHLLRRSSIDELPQLFNVIGGTMSLVGPRPQRDGEVALYTGSDRHRLGVRPGMTGLWQVSGRSDLEWSEAREFDLYYAHNWNLKNDLGILFRTFGAVVRAAGAR
ncbi:hypothetical protein KACC15558_23810 [Brevibacterium ammoniilyticum]|uniref:Bacterial sugar transferase domain-containing protein n=1 Tax=Brevibacterium ammoniilyticum TaxID=1046555 RepID=A0ABP9U6S3_9MICO